MGIRSSDTGQDTTYSDISSDPSGSVCVYKLATLDFDIIQ